ncbi:type II secretion system minor pseudopilin GspK [Sulfitobacter sp. D35]|uniref:type II secretion system minor pseudopilin GspK n=1 Tax=Sulfitobacter sp. D35 TaxID=3083252 RepID=UPI00296E4A98|nr:type II secretion system minor pseudopilin GspK [Sulfitobacter sp. D35]MDW4500488.1 type II secretion system minor pseudopilin GspK [Sulfitobacter sp. D35]
MRDRGFVLVNVLVIVMALSTVAAELMIHAVEDVEHLALQHARDRADTMSHAGRLLSIKLLVDDLDGPAVDHRSEGWALESYPAEVAGGTVAITVRDLEARFNLNLLLGGSSDAPTAALERLARSRAVAPDLVQRVVDRFAAEQPSTRAILDPAAAENFQPGDMTSSGQFTEINGLTGPDTGNFRADLSVLPRSRPVNVNTAVRDVLAAVTGLELEVIEALVALRSSRPFEDVSEFRSAVEGLAGPLAATELALHLLGVQSEWFEVETHTRYDGLSHRARTILHRDPETRRVTVFSSRAETTG